MAAPYYYFTNYTPDIVIINLSIPSVINIVVLVTN